MHCSFDGCWNEVIAQNQQARLLGSDEEHHQFIFRVWHACPEHLYYYTRMSGEALYQGEKDRGTMRMFFLLTREHLALACHLQIVWYGAENGAPGASIVRPYGNSDLVSDVARCIGYRELEGGERYTTDEERYLEGIHREMHLVVQIILHTGQMKLGMYNLPGLSEDWVFVERAEQEPELVLTSSRDQAPQPLYK